MASSRRIHVANSNFIIEGEEGNKHERCIASTSHGINANSTFEQRDEHVEVALLREESGKKIKKVEVCKCEGDNMSKCEYMLHVQDKK